MLQISSSYLHRFWQHESQLEWLECGDLLRITEGHRQSDLGYLVAAYTLATSRLCHSWAIDDFFIADFHILV